MTQTTRTAADISAEIDRLSAEEMLVETNEGTYGAAEAHRCIGVGDPAFADYRIYETVSGRRRQTGCDPAEAPGRARRLNGREMSAARKRLAELRRQYRAARRREERP